MSKIVWVAGIVLAIVATVLVNVYINSIESSQVAKKYLRLNPGKSLVAGDVVLATDLQTYLLPEKFGSLDSVAIPDTTENRQWILDTPIAKDVSSGEFLLHSHFIDTPSDRFVAQISENMRAIALSVNPVDGVAFFIEPGSKIDILGTFSRRVSGDEPVSLVDIETSGRSAGAGAGVSQIVETRTILQNIKVLAVDQLTTRKRYLDSGESGYRTITVEVTPLDAEKLVFGRSHARGSLSFVLRNPLDENEGELPAARWSSLDK